MKNLFGWLSSVFVAVAIGTFVSLLVLLGMLWWKGTLADERLLGMIAALQGIEAAPPEKEGDELDPNAEQPSFDQMVQARVQASLDLDLRESAIDKSLLDLRATETQIKTERERLDLWKTDFDQRLAQLETAGTDTALVEVQRTLEAMSPKQAKDQVLRMLEEAPTAEDDPMQDVVAIFKALPESKQKKLFAEFKTPDELDQLAEILHQIRLGLPDSELIRDTRNQLQQQLNPQR